MDVISSNANTTLIQVLGPFFQPDSAPPEVQTINPVAPVLLDFPDPYFLPRALPARTYW